MDARTLEALWGSIGKWQEIVDGTRSNGGTYDCPLCQLFHPNKGGKLLCAGCPVSGKTLQAYCNGSPYEEFAAAVDRDDEVTAKLCAIAELEFLMSLLPEAEMTRIAAIAKATGAGLSLIVKNAGGEG